MKLAIVIGTRPEAIKMAPVVQRLRRSESMSLTVISTGQHREMLKQVLHWFEITVDIDLELMQDNQSLSELSASCLMRLHPVFQKAHFDLILVQGDTTTAMIAALVAFYNKVPIGHVEAGLRTNDLQAPWPEELNRSMISKMARLHFAPTASARDNLIKENIDPSTILVTGNTVIDALLYTAGKVTDLGFYPAALKDIYTSDLSTSKVILITGHRRENFGAGISEICTAISLSAQENPDVIFVYPVHLNPNVRKVVVPILDRLPNVRLLPPLSYPEFVSLMQRCHFIITDSGGIQEEALSLGKPVLVTRRNTERPEGVEVGAVYLVGTDGDCIRQSIQLLLVDADRYRAMSSFTNPYGDGRAAERIVEHIGALSSSNA